MYWYLVISQSRIIQIFSEHKYSVRLSVDHSNLPFLADRTNGRAIGTVLRPSSVVVVVVVCDVMYCG